MCTDIHTPRAILLSRLLHQRTLVVHAPIQDLEVDSVGGMSVTSTVGGRKSSSDSNACFDFLADPETKMETLTASAIHEVGIAWTYR